MTDDGDDYADVLKEAQVKGYAEADPTFDVITSYSIHYTKLYDEQNLGNPFSPESRVFCACGK